MSDPAFAMCARDLFLIAMRWLFFLVLVPLHADQHKPLVGTWEGSWDLFTGMRARVHTFRFTFTEQTGKLSGRFIVLEHKRIDLQLKAAGSDELVESVETEHPPQHWRRVKNLVRTGDSPPAFRFDADDNCWNVTIEGSTMSGVLNGGECGPLGIGPGAKLLAVVAQRVETPTGGRKRK